MQSKAWRENNQWGCFGVFFSLYCHFSSFPSLEQSRRKGQILWPPLPLRKICQHAGGQHATKMPGFHRNVIETNEWLSSECEGGSQEDFKVHKKAGWSEVEGGCRTGMIIPLVLALCYLTRKTGILSFSQVHQYWAEITLEEASLITWNSFSQDMTSFVFYFYFWTRTTMWWKSSSQDWLSFWLLNMSKKS